MPEILFSQKPESTGLQIAVIIVPIDLFPPTGAIVCKRERPGVLFPA
jgi:hypothetical protein